MTRFELIADSLKSIRQELQDLEFRMDARDKAYELAALKYNSESTTDFDELDFNND